MLIQLKLKFAIDWKCNEKIKLKQFVPITFTFQWEVNYLIKLSKRKIGVAYSLVR